MSGDIQSHLTCVLQELLGCRQCYPWARFDQTCGLCSEVCERWVVLCNSCSCDWPSALFPSWLLIFFGREEELPVPDASWVGKLIVSRCIFPHAETSVAGTPFFRLSIVFLSLSPPLLPVFFSWRPPGKMIASTCRPYWLMQAIFFECLTSVSLVSSTTKSLCSL